MGRVLERIPYLNPSMVPVPQTLSRPQVLLFIIHSFSPAFFAFLEIPGGGTETGDGENGATS
jgi:hypothetical protein